MGSDVGSTKAAAVTHSEHGIVSVIVIGLETHTEQTVTGVLKPSGKLLAVVEVLPVQVSVTIVVTGRSPVGQSSR